MKQGKGHLLGIHQGSNMTAMLWDYSDGLVHLSDSASVETLSCVQGWFERACVDNSYRVSAKSKDSNQGIASALLF